MTASNRIWLGSFAVVIALCLLPATSTAQGVLFVQNNNVGIGVASPARQLHIDSHTANTDVILLRSTDGQRLLRMFETAGTGGVLSMYDSNNHEDFRISATGDSWFASAGEVGIGCTDPDHDLTIGGSGAGCNTGVFSEVDAGEAQFTTSSSRTIKENLHSVDADDILDKISGVEVYTYDFIDGPKDRLGIMAEDFHTIFGRGSDKMLSGQEVQMALWLAVQELAEHNRGLSLRNQELEERLEALEHRLGMSE